MIASENFVPQAVLDAAGSVLTNKYAEGYPGRRYYGGCEEVDVAEQLAIDRAKALFGADHANVQAALRRAGQQRRLHGAARAGDTFLGLALDHGGHLSHGMKINVSGKLYNPVAVPRPPDDLLVDMDEVARARRGAQAEADRRRLVRLPAPARLRRLPRDRRLGRRQADGRHGPLRRPRRRRRAPQPGAPRRRGDDHHPQDALRPAQRPDPVQEEHAKAIDKAIFPGQQGGPLMHTIAAKAVALRIAACEPFRARQRQTIANAKAFAAGLEAGGVPVLTGGTDVHLVLVDLTPTGLDGQTAEDRLEAVGITVNRNAIPFDERPPMNPSGLRIGTPADHHPRHGRGRHDRDRRGDRDRPLRRLRSSEGRPRGAHPRPDGSLPALPAALARLGLSRSSSPLWGRCQIWPIECISALQSFFSGSILRPCPVWSSPCSPRWPPLASSRSWLRLSRWPLRIRSTAKASRSRAAPGGSKRALRRCPGVQGNAASEGNEERPQTVFPAERESRLVRLRPVPDRTEPNRNNQSPCAVAVRKKKGKGGGGRFRSRSRASSSPANTRAGSNWGAAAARLNSSWSRRAPPK